MYNSGVLGKVMAGDTDLWVIGLWVGFEEEITREVQSKSDGKEEAGKEAAGQEEECDALTGWLCLLPWGQGRWEWLGDCEVGYLEVSGCGEVFVERSKESIKENLWNEELKTSFSRTFNP